MSTFFINAGYNFYALDLHGYGRSLQSHQIIGHCTHINQYYHEITQAINIIKTHGNQRIIMMVNSNLIIGACICFFI
jgi:alpha-beta hydrolase superfamily lysophospholipase